MFIIKVFGIVLIIVSSTFIGVLKSRVLAERCKKLSLLSDGTNTLYNYISQGEYELLSAVKNAFCKCNFLEYKGNDVLCDDNDLKEDKAMIEEFFANLGHSGKKMECDRINCFKLKLTSRLKEAESDMAQKSKIYKTLGVCFGLTIGILLI